MSRIKGPLSGETKRRLFSIFIICIIGYSFLIYRLVDIQILKSKDYKKRVENQSTEKISLNSGRGIIYDRNNKPLTDSQKKQIVVVSKERLNNDAEVLNMIKKATNLSELDIYKIFQEQKDFNMIEIETDNISDNMKEILVSNSIIVEEKTLRYSEDFLLSHTIGHLKKADNSGQLGVERAKDDILTNSNEKYVTAFRAGDLGNKGNLDILKGSVKTIEQNEEDRHIRLTIDYDIQKKIENIANKEENPSAIVISDIKTGEVLSISSRPNFDQNNIAKYLEESEKDKGSCINRATNATYPPASVFKLVVLLAALEENTIDESYTYNCTGTIVVGDNNESLKCHKLDGHGVQSVESALSNSCNTAFYDIANKVGKDKIFEAAKKLKLNQEVDIGIEEAKGQMPENIHLRNLAIGQGSLEFTPLQINQMTQIIANNGTYRPLYLYDSIIDNNKNIVTTFKTSKEEEIISPYNMTKVKEMMKSVSKDGTAKELNDIEGGCGVKTGTAQSTKKNKPVAHGWITGFYPETNAKYAITIIIEGTEEKNKSAVPMFKEVCQALNKNN
ncbi:MAG: penicillin-binding protein 2 [Romboutsia sp.]